MREYPNAPNVFRINSTSSIFDIEQYHQRMLKNSALSQDNQQRNYNLNDDIVNGCGYHHSTHGNGNHVKKFNYHDNHGPSSPSSPSLPPPESIPTTSSSAAIASRMHRMTNATDDQTNCYSLLGALTSAVTGGTCGSSVHPIQDDMNASGSEANGNHNQNNNGSNDNNSDGRRAHHNELRKYGQRESLTRSGSINSYRTYTNDNYKNSYLLWIVTPVAASFAVAIVIASLAGPQWLLTEEKIPNMHHNRSAAFSAKDEDMYITKYTKSSLWILCYSQGKEYHCQTIEYFPNEEYSPDPNDSTMAIPYAITKSTPFFLFSGCVLVISYIILMMALCSEHHTMLFFFSGIFFIISGLVMLIGIIMYISLFKSEIGSKLRPSVFLPPLFTYKYGHSFILFVVGCISAEIVGTLNFFLFIRIREVGREKTIPCFLYAQTAQKSADTDKSKRFVESLNTPPHYKCQKHPTVPNAFFSPTTQRRYFFEKPQSCNVHRKNLAKSLNELYTEPAPITLFPFDLPNEFPLTRSVSTTTDIFSTCSGGGGGGSRSNGSHKSFKTLTPQPRKRSNSQSMKYMNDDGSRDSLNDICGMTKGILTNRNKSKDELFMEFCKRAGQRPKPKDIYFIEKSPYDNAAEESVFVVDNYGSLRRVHRNGQAMPVSNMRKPSNIHNSNQSLKDVNNINSKKSYPIKNIFDAGSFGGSTDTAAIFLNNRVDNYLAQQRNNSRDSNLSLYQSRTLPRDFLKRNVDFVYDDDRFPGRRVSASGIFAPYNENMSMAMSSSAIANHPPPIIAITPELNKTFNAGNMDAATANTEDYYKKSYDALASRNSRQCDAYTGGEEAVTVQWPNAIPGSPSSFSSRSQFRVHNGTVYQHAPPQRLTTFYSQLPTSKQQPVRNESNEENDAVIADENSVAGSEEYGTFDLDRIEKERRKSHASLFEIDFVNGTPV